MSESPYPPAEPPADGDRHLPRYSASASVPVPPSIPPPVPPAPTGGLFGQGSPFGPGMGNFVVTMTLVQTASTPICTRIAYVSTIATCFASLR